MWAMQRGGGGFEAKMGTTKVWGFLQSVAAPTATSPHCRLLAAVLLGENIEPAAKVLGTVSSVREVCSHGDQARRASILVLSKAGMPEDGCSFIADPAELGWDDFSRHLTTLRTRIERIITSQGSAHWT